MEVANKGSLQLLQKPAQFVSFKMDDAADVKKLSPQKRLLPD